MAVAEEEGMIGAGAEVVGEMITGEEEDDEEGTGGAGAAADVVGAVAGEYETGAGAGAGLVPLPPPNFPAKHFSISATSVSPSGTRESTYEESKDPAAQPI